MAKTDNDDLINIIESSNDVVEIPEIVPLLPVRDVVVFTDMLLPLFVGREKSIKAVESALTREKLIFLVAQKDPANIDPDFDDMFKIGTVSKILRTIKLPDGRIKALVQGIAKAEIIEFVKDEPDLEYCVKIKKIKEIAEKKDVSLSSEALMRNVRSQCEKILSLRGEMNVDITTIIEGINDTGKLADLIASNLKLKVEDAQTLLELSDSDDRLARVHTLLTKEVEVAEMQAKIQSDVRDEISKTQKDYYLREQMRAINRELGEYDDKHQEMDEYKKKIKQAKMPKDIAKEAKKQLKRLGQMHGDASEASIIRTYLDWLVELPWSKSTKDMLNLITAKEVLNKEHYGLEKVKDRILEYLSVRKLNPKVKGQILCFVGPPGVGKTSLGKAIAKAINRKFIRISLGGVRDEAEIRGHRRTYVGALPGRILQGLKQCSSNNPVFMMDEVDKIGSDFRGDPSSALLEVLDPEQNFSFSDHYINLPFDLSKVMFILTANMTDTIPYALLDRMEVISLSGYMEEEKSKIAKKFLIPRQVKENGLSRLKSTLISDGALCKIIREYTSEAGVRNLEREIGSVCRKIARKIAEGDKGRFFITQNNMQKYLGLPKYYPEMDQEESQVGLATGLAWTQMGGEVLYIEASFICGKGDLIVTGQIGEVMQESARAALSYIRANMDSFGADAAVFENIDIHIHVPAGAIPKDGPSAGIAMATAIISVLTKRSIITDVAMTGEITLRGRVLPIGGLKEKALGALRGGIKTVIIPEKNRKDLSEIPKIVKNKIKFICVKNLSEVLPIAMENWKDFKKKKKGK